MNINIQYQLELIRKTRSNFLKIIDNYSLEQINKIPEGFNNNLGWNLGHIIVTQQILCYTLSNIDPRVDQELITIFRKGTKPEKGINQEELETFKILAISTIDHLEEDYKNEVFQTFKHYQTSYGVELNNIEQAVQFNAAHEALHLGSIMALRKFLK